jgi:hypothetical protein
MRNSEPFIPQTAAALADTKPPESVIKSSWNDAIKPIERTQNLETNTTVPQNRRRRTKLDEMLAQIKGTSKIEANKCR